MMMRMALLLIEVDRDHHTLLLKLSSMKLARTMIMMIMIHLLPTRFPPLQVGRVSIRQEEEISKYLQLEWTSLLMEARHLRWEAEDMLTS